MPSRDLRRAIANARRALESLDHATPDRSTCRHDWREASGADGLMGDGRPCRVAILVCRLCGKPDFRVTKGGHDGSGGYA